MPSLSEEHKAPAPFASCDTMVVLGPGTRAGATLLAKNSDRSAAECQPLFRAPHRVHATGATVNCQYLEIPQAAETYALIGSRPFWLWGFEHGINEHGVAIGNEAVLTRETLPATGLLGMDLVRLGLERSRSAREASELIGALIERFGQGGSGAYDFDFRYSGGFIIADHSDAYVLESSGRQWAARRVADRACVSNRLSLSTVEFASADAESHARERAWWSVGDAPFDFAAAYGPADNPDPLLARGRLERSRAMLAGGGRRTLREMFAMLRDHHGEGELPPAADAQGGGRGPSICMHGGVATTASMVAELPAPDSESVPVMWASMGAPCTGIFFPLYTAGTLPPVLAAGGAAPSNDSPWWRMKRVQDLAAKSPARLAPIVWKHFRTLEVAMVERAAEVGRKAANLDSPARAAVFGAFMAQNTVRVLNAIAQVEAELLSAG